ncbi:MAG TPA: ClbS/DfsB family four-helix bundle protein [Anaerolineales bacterium]|nr:ClbS/DfsB family four-helix bundle protein [Anaerolineales bacterium]
MNERQVSTKVELLSDIEQSWTRLNAALNQLTDAQLTTIQDAQGWTVKDHVIHLTRWERSVVFFLQGLPRHQGLSVEEALYLEGSDDAINAAIYQETREISLDALAQFRAIHQQLLQLLQPLTDDDLQKRYRDYLPQEPGDGDGPTAMNVIYGNTAHHFNEHLEWIEALTNKTG